MSRRQYPELSVSRKRPIRPLSIIVVHFSDDYFHNILKSECVHDSFNQFITVDNRRNLFFDNLSQAINAGLDQAQHELMMVVHEDVLLLPGWHERFEKSLLELEKVDPRWGMLGSAGWTDQNSLVGHWSDPHQYSNTLVDTTFVPVGRLDEQLMIFRKSSGIRLDAFLPSIHNVGRDLASTLQERGFKTYVLDAPTIHKFADEQGNLVEEKEDSPKIQGRKLPSYIADRACCDEYLNHKWPEWRPKNFKEEGYSLSKFSESVRNRLERPVVLLARGGSGSRLLSSLAIDAGVFLGNDLNISGDSRELVQALYRGVLAKYLWRASWQKQRIISRIRLAAALMLEEGQSEGLWGFKLPESMLLVPEIDQAFREARYIHLIRDPLTTCLRRTHMTARFDNTIGRVAIPLAYRHCGRDLIRSLDDSSALHMAYTTIHQIETVRAYARSHLRGRYLEVRFEEVLATPMKTIAAVTQWLGTEPQTNKLETQIDPRRAVQSGSPYPREVEDAVARIVAPLRRKLGYL